MVLPNPKRLREILPGGYEFMKRQKYISGYLLD